VENGDDSEMAFNFAPDPSTGMAVLEDAGSFGVTGPGGLDASFTAPSGTTGAQLAAIFAADMTIPGYNVELVGSEVVFSTDDPGNIKFQTDGDGIDYEAFPSVPAVPEPSTLTLFGLALLCCSAIAWRRRSARKTP